MRTTLRLTRQWWTTDNCVTRYECRRIVLERLHLSWLWSVWWVPFGLSYMAGWRRFREWRG